MKKAGYMKNMFYKKKTDSFEILLVYLYKELLDGGIK